MRLVACLYKRKQTRNPAFFVALAGLHYGYRSGTLSDGNLGVDSLARSQIRIDASLMKELASPVKSAPRVSVSPYGLEPTQGQTAQHASR
jgi:hypothetical protein